MTKSINVAVLGATGQVGETIIELLQDEAFPIKQLYPLASHRSKGNSVLFQDKLLLVEDVEQFDFSQAQLALFAANSEVSARYADRAIAKGCIVIDNTAHFQDDDIPVVSPQLNSQHFPLYKQRGIIANPCSLTQQLLFALKPIYETAGISRIQVIFGGQFENTDPDAYTAEESRMNYQVRKILGDESILVNSMLGEGQGMIVHIETKQKLSADAARQLLDQSMISRIREDLTHPLGLNLWIKADDVRKVAAHNSVQIAKILIKEYL